MGPTVALLKHLPPGAAARFVTEILRPLTDYDRERNGALIDTLASYLRHRGSLRKAADELFVHSNTVQLRLARASQLTGIDLHDPRQLGILSLAFAWRGEPPPPTRVPDAFDGQYSSTTPSTSAGCSSTRRYASGASANGTWRLISDSTPSPTSIPRMAPVRRSGSPARPGAGVR